MRLALRLARRAWGMTSPNPLVGAVVVRDGVCVGQGWHHRAGTPHAEVHALAAAGGKAAGATLYVTLEPCCTHGRTPPCTDAIITAGVRRVVVGCTDPNPKHAGRGVELLRQQGIVTECGVEEAACRDLNEAFFAWITTGRPYVLLKLGMTLDGKIATAAGESKWITGAQARAKVQELRRWADAIMVGAETVRRDNPELTVREPADWWRQPQRLIWTRQPDVLDRGLRVFADPARPPRCVQAQTRAEWLPLLTELGRQGVTSLLIEGGGELAGHVLQAGVVDKVAFFVAPKLLGGRGSRPAVAGPDPADLAAAVDLQRMTVRHVGADLMITGYPTYVHGPH